MPVLKNYEYNHNIINAYYYISPYNGITYRMFMTRSIVYIPPRCCSACVCAPIVHEICIESVRAGPSCSRGEKPFQSYVN